MNRGYKVYRKEGKRIAKETLKKKGNIFKYYLRGIISYIGKITFIVSPITRLADVRAAKYARENKDIVIMKSFASGDEPRNLYNTYLSGLYQGIIFIAGIILNALLIAASFAVGYGLSTLFEESLTYLIVGAFLLPGAIVLICWLIVYPLYMSPAAYVLDSIKTNATDSIGKSYNAMSKGGKRTVFWNNFMAGFKVLLRIVFYGAIIAGVDYVTAQILGKPLLLLVIIPFVVLLALRGIAKVLLTRSVVEILLFEDLVFDKYQEAKEVKGIDLVRAKTIKKDISNTKDNLIKLFDETKQVKRSDEYDNDMFDDVFKQEAKAVTSVVHKISESKDIEVTNVEVYEPKPIVEENKEQPVQATLVELEDTQPIKKEELNTVEENSDKEILTNEMELNTQEETIEEVKPTIEIDEVIKEGVVEEVKSSIDLNENELQENVIVEEVEQSQEVVLEEAVEEETTVEESQTLEEAEQVNETLEEQPQEETKELVENNVELEAVEETAEKE